MPQQITQNKYSNIASNHFTNITKEDIKKPIEEAVILPETIFEEEPVDFRTFVTSPDYLNFIDLSPAQYDPCYAVLYGVPFEEYDQYKDKISKNIFENQSFSIAVLLWGKGCIAGDTIIHDALEDKDYTVEKLYKLQKEITVQCIDSNTNLHYARSSIPWIKGEDDLYLVETESRKRIKVTLEHKFKTLHGWSPLKDLKVGDLILDDDIKNISKITCKICNKEFHNIYGHLANYSHGKTKKLDKIIKIEFYKKDIYYDLEVPVYHNYLANGLYNHNSGKDTLSALVICYITYFLLCCKNPQQILNLPPDESIDIVNVAYSADQAMNVFFEKLKQRIIHNIWLKTKYPIVLSNQLVSEKEKEVLNQVKITRNAILFPKGIRMFSKHCVSGDTLILTPFGWKKIIDINIGEYVTVGNNQYKVKSTSGCIDDVYKVTLKNGLSIECNLNHKFNVIRNKQFVKISLSELKVGDYLWYFNSLNKFGNFDKIEIKQPYLIGDFRQYKKQRLIELILNKKSIFEIKNTLKIEGMPISSTTIASTRKEIKLGLNKDYKFFPDNNNLYINNELAWLLGIFIAEGTYKKFIRKGRNQPSYSIQISQYDELVGKRIQEYGRLIFGDDFKCYKNKKDRGCKYMIYNYRIAKIFEQLGFRSSSEQQFMGDKYIPDLLMNLPEEQMKYFIAGLWDGDGCLGTMFRYASVSLKLINKISLILNNFGIPVNICIVKQKNILHKDLYEIFIPSSFKNKFIELFPMVKIYKHKKNWPLAEEQHLLKYADIGSLILDWYKMKIKKGINVYDDNTPRDCQYETFSSNFIKKKIWLHDNPIIKFLMDNNLFASAIKSIEYIGKKQLYCLEVDTISSFNANGIYSSNSELESIEGLNLISYIMDEASAFRDKSKNRNANKIFDMLNTSAESRFGSRYKGFILSYPRYKGDFTMQMYEESLSSLQMYGVKLCTWEARPFPGPTFKFEKWNVPISLKYSFDHNPKDAKAKYCCEPPSVESPFIQFPEKVDEAIDHERLPIVEVEDYYSEGKIRKRITKWNIAVSTEEFLINIDLGLKNDAAGLSVTHKEDDKLIVDLIVSWDPQIKDSKGQVIKEAIVDLNNIEEFIKELKTRIRIGGVYFDRWNSALLVQRLSIMGIHSDVYNLKYSDYKTFIDLLYSDRISLLNDGILISEIKQLQSIKSEKVDHPEGGTKDKIDCIVGAVKVLFTSEGERLSAEGEFIYENLHEQGGEWI